MVQKLPKGWKVRKLGEVTDIFKGGTPKRSIERYFEGDIAWAIPTDITKLNGALYIDDTETHITEEALGKSSAKLLPSGTVLLTSRATIGKVAISRIPMATNQGFANFLCKKEIDNHYLAYYLKAKTDLLISLGTGTTFLEVTKGRLLEVEIPLPPLPTQRKIAAILSAYDDLIENNTRRIKILEDMAQTLYQEWFVHFRFPGHENVPMVESELGQIPQGWEVVPASEAMFVNPKTSVPCDTIKPFVPMKSATENSMLITEIEERAGNSGAKFKNGDTLFARITPCLENGRTGFVQCLSNEDEIAFGSTEFIVLRSKTLNPYFVYLLAQTRDFRENAIKSMTGATGRQRVLNECFDDYFLPNPNPEILCQFEPTIAPLFRKVQNLSEKNTNLRQTRDLLLPKFISGEIDVSELDIDTVRKSN